MREGLAETDTEGSRPVNGRDERPVESEDISMRDASARDPVVSAVIHSVVTGEACELDSDEARFYLSERHRPYLSVRDGVLVRSSIDGLEPQVVVPSSLRASLMALAHGGPLCGHFGVHRTLKRLTSDYFWFNIKFDVRQHCRQCVECARVKRPSKPSREGISRLPVIGEPFMQWSADFLGPLPQTTKGNSYVLVLSDLFTKDVQCYSLPDQSALSVADCIIDLISRFGVPKELLTDQGRQFESSLIKIVCDKLGIKKLRTSPYHPQCDGQTERFNRTLCDSLTFLVNENQSDWDVWLPVAVGAYRTSVHSTTGFSPFELVHGVKPRTPVVSEFDDDQKLCSQSYKEYLSHLNQCLSIREQALLNIERCQSRTVDPGDSQFNEGDKVMLRIHAVKRGLTRKLSDRFKGPYEIVSVRRPNYLIRRGRERKLVHGCHLKKVDVAVVTEPKRDADVDTPSDVLCDVPVLSDIADAQTDVVQTDVPLVSSDPVASDDSVSDVPVAGEMRGEQDDLRCAAYVTRFGRSVRPPNVLDL